MEPEAIEILETANVFETASTLETTFSAELPLSNNAMELYSEIDSASGSISNTTKSSHVWLHFNKDANFKMNKKSHCKYCKKTYICSKGSTSNMSNHLNKFHAIKLQPGTNIKTENILNVLTRAKVNIQVYLLFKNFILNNNI